MTDPKYDPPHQTHVAQCCEQIRAILAPYIARYSRRPVRLTAAELENYIDGDHHIAGQRNATKAELEDALLRLLGKLMDP